MLEDGAERGLLKFSPLWGPSTCQIGAGSRSSRFCEARAHARTARGRVAVLRGPSTCQDGTRSRKSRSAAKDQAHARTARGRRDLCLRACQEGARRGDLGSQSAALMPRGIVVAAISGLKGQATCPRMAPKRLPHQAR